MTTVEIRQWLESEIENYPDRIPGEVFYEFVMRLIGMVIESDRTSVIEVLKDWIRDEKIPHSDLAIKTAFYYKLRELYPDVEAMIKLWEKGNNYEQWYAKHIESLLQKSKNPFGS